MTKCQATLLSLASRSFSETSIESRVRIFASDIKSLPSHAPHLKILGYHNGLCLSRKKLPGRVSVRCRGGGIHRDHIGAPPWGEVNSPRRIQTETRPLASQGRERHPAHRRLFQNYGFLTFAQHKSLIIRSKNGDFASFETASSVAGLNP
jgi:hypothetical protein